MRITLLTKIFVLLLAVSSVAGGMHDLFGQDVIRASGGTNLSIDRVTTQEFATLSGPTIRETTAGQLAQGRNIILSLPPGYIWNTALTGTEITILVEPVGAQNTKLAVSFGTFISATEVSFTVNTASSAGGAGQGPGRFTVSGLQVRPNSTAVPNTGQISNTGSTGPNLNYGDLSTTQGAIATIQVETEANGSGELVQAQELRAGDPLTVYSIARDMGGNFIENISLDDTQDWSLINTTGGINSSNLEVNTNRNGATFSSQLTGTAQIQAYLADADVVPSETITITPRDATQLQINTQPSPSAVAGAELNVQPVIHLLDQFGNLVTADNSTIVTASISSGQGPLSGTTSATANAGIVEFTDLSLETANTITLQFSGNSFDSVISNEIMVSPGPIAQLQFITTPTSGGQGATLNPITVQLLDSFGNEILQSGVQINAAIESGGGQLQGTTSETTDSNGQAVFDDLRFNTSGQKTIRFELNSDNSIFTISDPIEIFGSGVVSNFTIETTDQNPIGTQTAGESFDIRITAIDGDGVTVPDFSGTVDLSSTSAISVGGGTTASFSNGVLETHSITLTSSGNHTITAAKSDQTVVTGSSDSFEIEPATVDFSNSELTANPAQITADGESTSEITLQLKDTFGNNLLSGGEAITLETNTGELTGSGTPGLSVDAIDNNNGTYSATLTSTTTIETATVEAFENEISIASINVDFTAGGVDRLIITLPDDGGTPENQIAGEPFEISIEAVDENGNRVTSYSGELTFTSTSIISEGSTATIENGFLENHSITLTRSGSNVTLTAEDTEIFGLSGTSENFVVQPSTPDVTESNVLINPSVIQNDGISETTLTIILRDQFGNRITTDLSGDLSLNAVQLELDGNPSSGNPDASIGTLSFMPANTFYQAIITSSTTNEVIEIFANYAGSELEQSAVLEIVIPNTWQPSGAPQQRQDWTRGENWSLGTEPGSGDFVIIPGGLSDYPDLDLNPNIGSLEVQSGGQLVLFGGNSITVSGSVLVDGTLDIEDNTSLIIGGDFDGSGTFASGESALIEIGGNVSIQNLLARTNGTVLKFNGSTQQNITTPNLLIQRMEVLNDVLVTSGDLIDTAEIFIDEGFTFELAEGANITVDNLENITGEGSLILNDNTLVVRGDLSLLNIDTTEGTVIFGIRLDEVFEDYPNLQQQQIANLSQMQNATINNIYGVRTFDDVVINNDGTLTLENGELIISSGRNFIASNIVYNNGFLTFRRTIAQPGWRMISSPVATNFGDFFDGLTTQGLTGSTFPDRQPNILFYDETTPGTDNQRWRSPANSTDNIETGKGYFFYVFGDVAEDTDYNDILPITLTASGQENQATASEFTFPVTYTAEADTGWNVMGNPFGATLNWDEAGWVKENIDNVIYIWDEVTNQYRYWNGTTGSHNSGLIAPFQSFWVKANADNPELTVNTSAKTVGGTFRKEVDRYKNVPVIALELESDFYSTSTHFSFSENGSFNTDRKDAYRLLPFDTNTYLEIFSLFNNGTELAINNLPRDFNTTIKIPIQVGAVKDGSHFSEIVTLTWPELVNIPDSWTVELVDLNTDNRINLKEESFYDFEIKSQGKSLPQMNTVENFRLLQKSTSGSKTARFELHISPGEDGSEFPAEVELNQNYPNPFNPATSINFGIPTEDNVRIDVYDLLGRRVQTLTNQRYQAGYHQVHFDGGSLASGIYFYRLITSGKIINKRMTLIK